jgi:hypothetical protein
MEEPGRHRCKTAMGMAEAGSGPTKAVAAAVVVLETSLALQAPMDRPVVVAVAVVRTVVVAVLQVPLTAAQVGRQLAMAAAAAVAAVLAELAEPAVPVAMDRTGMRVWSTNCNVDLC